MLRDVRDVDPARVQARARDPLDPAQRLRLYGSELREVDGRQRGQRRAARDGATAAQDLLHERLHVVGRDAPLVTGAAHAGKIDAELARELAHGRARVRLAERRRRRRDRGRHRDARHARGRRRRSARGRCLRSRSRGHGRGCSRRRRGRGRCGRPRRRRRARRARPQHEHRIAGRHARADRDLELEHRARERRGHVHARLLGLQSDEPLFRRDLVAGLHEHVDDLDVREVAEIGHDDRVRRGLAERLRLADGLVLRSAGDLRLTHGLVFRRAHLLRLAHGRVSRGARVGHRASVGPGARAVRREREDHVALRHAIADLDLERVDAAGRRRRHVHRRLLGLERDEPLLGGDLVTGLHEDLDDLYVGKVAEVGYDNVHVVLRRRRSVTRSPGCASRGRRRAARTLV